MGSAKPGKGLSYIYWTSNFDSVTLFIREEVAALLGDILCVELPEVGETLMNGDLFASIQGLTDSIFLEIPFEGRITAVNSRLERHPDLLRGPCFGESWLVCMTVKNQRR